MLRSFLLAPCLLICLSCAKPIPFPIESLEEGMTAEAVRDNFGEPDSWTHSWGAESSWRYVHEEQNWIGTFHPVMPLVIPFIVFDSDLTWSEASREVYVKRKPVVLYFEAEKLVRWEVIEPDPVVDDYDPFWMWDDDDDLFPEWDNSPVKDAMHHTKGHPHHHVDHDDPC
ncbi:MAG: hypothetical protein IH974_01050 [Myxococcales bacterium]|nr:hypothetical protein [Myxococcales bacterium]